MFLSFSDVVTTDWERVRGKIREKWIIYGMNEWICFYINKTLNYTVSLSFHEREGIKNASTHRFVCHFSPLNETFLYRHFVFMRPFWSFLSFFYRFLLRVHLNFMILINGFRDTINSLFLCSTFNFCDLVLFVRNSHFKDLFWRIACGKAKVCVFWTQWRP